jgi:hypothetical protein
MEENGVADGAGEFGNMTEEEMETFLTNAIEAHGQECDGVLTSVRTFAQAGLLTRNSGLVVQIGEASFQITIVRE